MQPDASVAPTVIMTRFAVVSAVALVVTLTGMGTVRCASGQRSPAYPAVYQSENLPELPGATLVSTGRQQTSLRDGLRLRLTSSMTLDEIRDFYREALEEQGWEERQSPASRSVSTLAGMLTFTKDTLTYAVIITAPPGADTQVMTNVVER